MLLIKPAKKKKICSNELKIIESKMNIKLIILSSSKTEKTMLFKVTYYKILSFD